MKKQTIVIDFDGTCVTHDFPDVGQSIGAEHVLKQLVANGHRLVLFTMRSDIENPTSDDPDIHCKGGKYLTDAVNWFYNNGIQLYGIQTNPDQKNWTTSPKAYGHIIIDDAALGCPLSFNGCISHRPYVNWRKVAYMLYQKGLLTKEQKPCYGL